MATLLFVYGSLMNAPSRKQTLGRQVRARRAALRPRARARVRWCFRSARHRMPCLGAQVGGAAAGEAVAGMVLWLNREDLAALDVREEGYDRINLPRGSVCDHNNAPLDADVQIYAVRAPHPPTAEFPITPAYRQLCSARMETDEDQGAAPA